jgi:hypothetical protein
MIRDSSSGKTRRSFWDVTCLGVLCVVLSLGLWPFHSPQNDVTWLENRNGLRFGRFSLAVSSSVFQKTSSEGETSVTIEVWLQPRRIWNSGTFLAFYTPGKPYPFSLRQFDGGLKLQAEIRNGPRDAETVILYVKDTFRKSAPVFLTITSGKYGTAVYTDGGLAQTAPQVRFSTKELIGRFVVGDSPGQSDSWSGQLLGLAIYGQELTATQVLRHYQTWTQKELPEISDNERNLALYLLGERTGSIIHDSAGSGVNLYIPEKYAVMDQIFLEPFWKEFSMSRSYWSAVVKNIVGFVPFGFCFCACLSEHKVTRAGLAAVTLGTLVSLTIEVLQGYLPTRDSGMTDIFTNTLGTYIGVIACRTLSPVLAGKFPWLPFADQPHS